jgi:RNA recognition motif-containing protein
MKKIFVGNLSWKTTEEDLKKHFEKYGKVISAKIVIDKNDQNKSKGFGFVEMEDAEAAETAIRELNGAPLLDRPLRISLAQEREQRPPRDRDNSYGGGGGGSRSGGYGQGRRSTM